MKLIFDVDYTTHRYRKVKVLDVSVRKSCEIFARAKQKPCYSCGLSSKQHSNVLRSEKRCRKVPAEAKGAEKEFQMFDGLLKNVI